MSNAMANGDVVNGKRAEWRDATAAQLARLEPEQVSARKELALRMIKAGASTGDIMSATRQATGTGIGAGTVARLREEMEADQKRAQRQAARAAARAAAVPAPPKPDAEWVRLPATIEVVTALVTARVAFVFDGQQVSLKGGAR